MDSFQIILGIELFPTSWYIIPRINYQVINDNSIRAESRSFSWLMFLFDVITYKELKEDK